jgi:DNA repair exonuclease SbcCD nuclease subunit
MLPGQEVMISKHDLDLVGADYYALGHIHLNQELRNNMWYAGSIYHHDFGETEEKYFNVVDIEQGQVSVRRERIITRPLSLHIITIGTDGVIIRDESKANDWHGADLRVRVHLSQEQVGLTSDEEIIKHFPGAATYHIQRIVTPEERVRSENISLAKTLRSRLIEWACTIDKILPAAVLTKADEMEAVIHSIEP